MTAAASPAHEIDRLRHRGEVAERHEDERGHALGGHRRHAPGDPSPERVPPNDRPLHAERIEERQQEARRPSGGLIAVGESTADASLDQPALAAYTMVANQLMNLDEVLNK